MIAKETQTVDVQTTAQGWGYRELSAEELCHVSGGDSEASGDGNSGGCNFPESYVSENHT